MNIEEAIQQFKTEQAQNSGRALREVVNFNVDHNIKTEFNNDCYLDALRLTSFMFGRTHESVRMLTGSSVDFFLSELDKSFTDALKRIAENQGEFRVIVLGKAINSLKKIRDTHGSVFKFIEAQSSVPLRHFLVCDSNMVRLEELHGPLDLKTEATAVKARVHFCDLIRAKMLEENFDGLWEKLIQSKVSETPISSDEILHTN
jgi:hypothetical protein